MIRAVTPIGRCITCRSPDPENNVSDNTERYVGNMMKITLETHKFGVWMWRQFGLYAMPANMQMCNSPEKLLHNRIITPAIGPNKSRKLTRLIAPAHNIRGKVWMKNNVHGYTADNSLSVKPCMLFFIQTLPRILCAGTISRVSFLDLFGPIAGAINPIM